MTKKRDTVIYELKKGNEVVYVGTTNNADRRKQEHVDLAKNFDSMKVTSRNMTADGAKEKERERLATYRQNHQGKNPKYNKDDDG